MNLLAEFGTWISSNESLLSGLAAMIVLAGVVLSPLGVGLRRAMGARSDRDDPDRSRVSGDRGARAGSGSPSAQGPDRQPRRLTFQDLTAPAPSEIHFADSDGVRIAYCVRGEGPHTIVLAPGIVSHLHPSSNMPATKGTLDALSGFARVVTFDKRGQGLSDPTIAAPDLEERTRDIEAVMDAAGVDRAILMGFSEAGPMCLNFAHANPARVQGLADGLPNAEFLEVNAADHADLSCSADAVDRVRAFCDRVDPV